MGATEPTALSVLTQSVYFSRRKPEFQGLRLVWSPFLLPLLPVCAAFDIAIASLIESDEQAGKVGEQLTYAGCTRLATSYSAVSCLFNTCNMEACQLAHVQELGDSLV